MPIDHVAVAALLRGADSFGRVTAPCTVVPAGSIRDPFPRSPEKSWKADTFGRRRESNPRKIPAVSREVPIADRAISGRCRPGGA